MIQSQFILDILELSLTDCKYERLLRLQIPFLFEKGRQHTGVGMYIYFNTEGGADKYRISEKNEPKFDIDGNSIQVLDGIEVTNTELSILADAAVHIKNGLIDSVEIWNKNGEEYPSQEPDCYELTQAWLDISQRRTIVR
jgi:hypothetical protein